MAPLLEPRREGYLAIPWCDLVEESWNLRSLPVVLWLSTLCKGNQHAILLFFVMSSTYIDEKYFNWWEVLILMCCTYFDQSSIYFGESSTYFGGSSTQNWQNIYVNKIQIAKITITEKLWHFRNPWKYGWMRRQFMLAELTPQLPRWNTITIVTTVLFYADLSREHIIFFFEFSERFGRHVRQVWHLHYKSIVHIQVGFIYL